LIRIPSVHAGEIAVVARGMGRYAVLRGVAERVRQILGTQRGPDPHDRLTGLTVQLALGLQRAAARTTITSFASAVCAAGRVPLDIGAQALRPV
jgi:hypothetical protein